MNSIQSDYRQICNEIADILTKKRQDYGDPARTLGRFGLKGILVRLSDKFERLYGLIWEEKTPNFEGIEDTFLDIGGYAVLALEMIREERKNGNANNTYELHPKPSCLGFENQSNGRICNDCLYSSPEIGYCWKKNELHHWSEPCCCDFIDYEK